MVVVASLSQGRTAAAQCGLFTYKSVPVIFEPPCMNLRSYPPVKFSKKCNYILCGRACLQIPNTVHDEAP